MTAEQRLSLRQSEVREAINSLLGLDERTDEHRSELRTLTAEAQGLETEIRAAIVAAPDPDPATLTDGPEARERLELRGKARVADFVTAALTGRGVRGASAEYADSVGCAGLMPLDLLDAPEAREIETRAVTPGPSAETVASTRPTVPFAFSRTDAAALGISMPMVSPGEAHFPALTTAPPASVKAKDGAADSTAAAFSLTKRVPKRITGQFLIRVEDLALLPSMETDLRTAISGSVADNLDSQIVNGSGAGANLSGLFHQATDVAVAGDTEDFAKGVARFAALVDGKHANGFGDIRALIGTATFARYAGQFQSNGDVSLADYLDMKLGGIRVSQRVPAKSGNGQKGIVLLGAQGQPVTVPIWSGLELIVDPVTQAAKGQRVVTAVLLAGSPFVPYGAAQVVEINPKIS